MASPRPSWRGSLGANSTGRGRRRSQFFKLQQLSSPYNPPPALSGVGKDMGSYQTRRRVFAVAATSASAAEGPLAFQPATLISLINFSWHCVAVVSVVIWNMTWNVEQATHSVHGYLHSAPVPAPVLKADCCAAGFSSFFAKKWAG